MFLVLFQLTPMVLTAQALVVKLNDMLFNDDPLLTYLVGPR
jgi:hypothetical protein